MKYCSLLLSHSLKEPQTHVNLQNPFINLCSFGFWNTIESSSHSNNFDTKDMLVRQTNDAYDCCADWSETVWIFEFPGRSGQINMNTAWFLSQFYFLGTSVIQLTVFLDVRVYSGYQTLMFLSSSAASFSLEHELKMSHLWEFMSQRTCAVPLNWWMAQTAWLGEPPVSAQLSITRYTLPTLIPLSSCVSFFFPVLSITVWLRIPASLLITPPSALHFFIFTLMFQFYFVSLLHHLF